MAKTLVVKGVNYASNALDQVIIDVVECTGINITETTISIVATGNTSTLTTTVTPADCTQPIVWSTSDSNVATVANGVVTAVGIGTATITATCGSYSDTCSVTVTESMNKSNLLKMSGAYISGNNETSAGGNGLTVINTSSSYANRGTLSSATGDKCVNGYGSGYFYPYIMPKGTKRIKITDTGSSAIKKQIILWYNHSEGTQVSGYEDYCACLGQTVVSSINTNPYIVDVPTYENLSEVDAFVIMFRTYKTGTTFVDSDFDEVTVEFLPAA